MTEYNFSLPPQANEIDNALQGEKITLPFPAIYMYWLNGDRRYKPTDKNVKADARYFGGWASQAPGADEAVAEMARESMPAGFNLVDMVGDQDEYQVYISRVVSVALIGKRNRWIVTDEGGKRSHIQYLCYLAEIVKDGDKRECRPYGPVVLSARGFAGQALEDAIAKWGVKTATLRREAGNVPSWSFYIPVGTFGTEPVTKEVGSRIRRAITPAMSYCQDGITLADLHRLFVGKDIAAVMVELRRQASDWLEAWKTNQTQAHGEPAEPETRFTPPPPDDDVPF